MSCDHYNICSFCSQSTVRTICDSLIDCITVKAFVVTPKMTKNSIILRGGYDKGYKNFIADEIYLSVS